MNVSSVYSMVRSSGIIVENGGVVDDSLAALVLLSWFTDARAHSSDLLPDDSGDLRGWPGDTYSDAPWGSRLWLLNREKLTTDVRNRAVKYAEDALAWMLKDSGKGVMAKSVKVTGTVPQFQVLALTAEITKPDDSKMTVTAQKRWEAQRAV